MILVRATDLNFPKTGLDEPFLDPMNCVEGYKLLSSLSLTIELKTYESVMNL